MKRWLWLPCPCCCLCAPRCQKCRRCSQSRQTHRRHFASSDHLAHFQAPLWRIFWWTVELEGGPIPTTYSEWVEATARPNRWIDGPCLSTAATKLRRNIAIWKWENGQWGKQTVITPLPSHEQNVDDATKYPPLPLFLEDARGRTLKPGLAPFLMSWHYCPSDSKRDAGIARVPEVEALTEVGCRHPRGSPNRIAAGCLNHPQPAPKLNQLPSLTKAGPRLVQGLHRPLVAWPSRSPCQSELLCSNVSTVGNVLSVMLASQAPMAVSWEALSSMGKPNTRNFPCLISVDRLLLSLQSHTTCQKTKLHGHDHCAQPDCQACRSAIKSKQFRSVLQIATKVKLRWACGIGKEPMSKKMEVARLQTQKLAVMRKKKVRGHTPVQVKPTD